MARQSDSDPLPFVQVDRSAKPRAALLAGELGVTPQHALGSLVEWWDLNGDPRDLERIVEATAPGEDPAVLVSAEEAKIRFRLASGKSIEPVALVHLGLLEPVGERYRVRGMSRYFEPVAARLRARSVASKGGKARASQAVRNGFGHLTPAGPPAGASAGASAGESAGGRLDSRLAETSREPAESQPYRSAVSGQRSQTIPDLPGPEQFDLVDADPRSDPKERRLSPWETLWNETLKVDRLRQIAINDGFKSGLDEGFDREANDLEIAPAQLNTLLAKIAADLEREFSDGRDWSFEEKALAIELAWAGYIEGSFGASVDPPYALNAFASPKTSLPSYRRAKAGL